MKSVATLLPGINVDPYLDWDRSEVHHSLIEGYRDNVFLKDIYRNQTLDTVVAFTQYIKMHIVDYTHPNATRYWRRQLKRLKKLFHFDGVILYRNMITLDHPGNFNET